MRVRLLHGIALLGGRRRPTSAGALRADLLLSLPAAGAGYMAGERAIPSYPVQFDVVTDFGAKGDGIVGTEQWGVRRRALRLHLQAVRHACA